MPDTPPTILLVDDEPAIRRIGVRVLEKAGFKILDAGDGEEAFKVWQANRADIVLVISDVMMPKRNGWELLDAVRAEASEVPFVLTSGFDASDGRQVTPTDRVKILGKPWEAPRLVAAVKEMLA